MVLRMDPYHFTDSDSNSDFDGFVLQDVDVPGGNDNHSDNERVSAGSASDISLSDISSDDDDDDDDDEVDVEAPRWTNTNFQDTDVPYFTAPTGPAYPGDFNPREATPLQYFQLFMTDELLGIILENTNKYATKRQAEKDVRRERSWSEPLTMPELKAYLGMNILFGIAPLPRYDLYWSKSPYFANAGVNRIMTCKRYERISEYLHVSDPHSEPARGELGYDKLFKVRLILNHCEKTFPLYYRAGEHQSIDEGMIPCKSRIDFLQYMPDKPKKRGVKVFIRCESKSGYMHQFDVYLGAKNADQPKSRHGIYFDLVNSLTKTLRGKNHKVYFDNLYTSIPLLQYLQKHSIYCCGTLRWNRLYQPEEVKRAKVKDKVRGWCTTYQDENNANLTVTAWLDTKLVRFASTISKPDLGVQCMRRQGAMYLHVSQPHVAKQYNDHMGGVDKCDQMRQKYRVGRFAKKNWKYIMWWFISQMIVNAWILYQHSSAVGRSKRYKQLQFRHDIAQLLIGNFTSRQNPIEQQSVPSKHHENVHMGANRPKHCHGHKRLHGKAKETVYGCKECNLHLCKDCHNPFHNKV